MLGNYLKIAYRNLRRHGKHSLINILGLSVALAACIIVYLVIQHENSYDKHLKNYSGIYQVVYKYADAAGEHFESGAPFPLAKALRNEYSTYTFAQLMQNYGTQVTALEQDGTISPGKKFREDNGLFYGEPELARMFELRFIHGSADALKDVNSAVISRSIAEKYFGSVEKSLGRRFRFNMESHDFQVAGVFEDVPANSDFPFRILASYQAFEAYNGQETNWPIDDWGSNTSNHQIFVLIPQETQANAFARQVATLEKKYRPNEVKEQRTYLAQPLKQIHFDERFSNNGDHITSKTSLLTLGFVGILILLMAIINFVNLSTALAFNRGREVGVRKVMGSSQRQLSGQVYTETTLVVCLALILALVMVVLALPYVKNFMVVQERLDLFSLPNMMVIAGICIVVILLSGFYPAFVLGRFNPVDAIRNKISTASVGTVSIRRILVVLQFAFSQIFIIATIIAVSQMNFIRKTDLGFVKESVLLAAYNSDSSSHARLDALRNELMRRPDVKAVSFSFDAPSSPNSWETNFAFDKMEDRDYSLRVKFADHHYPDVYSLKLLAGRYYVPSDTVREWVVNETFLRKTGIRNPQEAIGKMLRVGGGRPKPVVGVVKDFKLASLREDVPPLAVSSRKLFYGIAGIRLSSQNLAKSRDDIKSIWDKIFPEYVYDPEFFDDQIKEFYVQEERLSRMYKLYALLAIFISCLGLYGLISFMVIRKTKEVGIRKVLGAGLGDILFLFSREFTILVCIAFVLAAPVAWYMMQQWLKDFTYRVNPGFWIFLVALIISVVIAWLTVGYKALQAALTKPVHSLRSE